MSDHQFALLQTILDKGLLSLLVIVAGFRLKKWNEGREAEQERHSDPKVEVDLNCRFMGPQRDEYLAVVSIRARNKGKIRWGFKSIRLRLRGIEEGAEFSGLERMPARLAFPMKLTDDDLVPDSENQQNYYWVDSQMEQVLTYVTRVPASVRFVLGRVQFRAMASDDGSGGDFLVTEERLFEVTAAPAGNPAAGVVAV